MKKLTVIVAAMLTVAVVCHAQGTAKSGTSVEERLKEYEKSFALIADTAGLPDKNIKLGSTKEITETTDSIRNIVQTERVQNARKTSLLEDLAAIFTKQYLGVVAKDMAALSEADKATMLKMGANIKCDLDRIVILIQTVKDREARLKGKVAAIADLETQILKNDAQIKDLEAKLKAAQGK